MCCKHSVCDLRHVALRPTYTRCVQRVNGWLFKRKYFLNVFTICLNGNNIHLGVIKAVQNLTTLLKFYSQLGTAKDCMNFKKWCKISYIPDCTKMTNFISYIALFLCIYAFICIYLISPFKSTKKKTTFIMLAKIIFYLEFWHTFFYPLVNYSGVIYIRVINYWECKILAS